MIFSKFSALTRKFGPVIELIKIPIPEFSKNPDLSLISNLIREVRQHYFENQAKGVVIFGSQEFLLGVAQNDVDIFVPVLVEQTSSIMNAENTVILGGKRYVIVGLIRKKFKLALHKPEKPKKTGRAFIIRISSQPEKLFEEQLSDLYPTSAISTIDPNEFDLQKFTSLISKNPPHEIILSDVWQLLWYLKCRDIKPLWEDVKNQRLMRVLNIVEVTEGL